MTNKYTLLIYEAEPDEGGYWAKVAELPGCATSGESLDELVANAHEAIDAWIEVTRQTGGTVPEPPRQWHVPTDQDQEEGSLFGVIGLAPSVAAA